VAFIISAGLSAFSGWMYSAYMGAVPASFGRDMQMYALASAVIGGVSLTGGIGKIHGVVGGVLLITIFNVGLQIMGISPYLVNTTGGIMIMIAVIIDALKNKYRAGH
jgi:simple sugar transport system permease protein/ribose transport system permease protein